MNSKIETLVKNVIEENIVKFKEDTSSALYSKLSNRLKDEYVNVSKNLFKSINEAAVSGVAPLSMSVSPMETWSQAAAATAGPPSGTPGRPSDEPRGNPDPGPPPINPYPDGPGKEPKIEDYPDTPQGKERFLNDKYAWERRIREIQEYKKRLTEWSIAHERWRNRYPTRGPDAPRKPKKKE